MRIQRSFVWLELSVLILLVFRPHGGHAQGFQWPEKPENIQVLPKEVTGRKLGEVMRGFATGLGVRCQHCHAAKAGQELDPMDLTTFDFSSDEKPEKAKARLMIRMVQAVNDTHLSQLDVPASERTEVDCVTCHRGQPRPRMLEDVLAETIENSGVENVIAKYRELRAEHYGGFSYNFQAGVLAGLAERLAGQGDTDDALAIADLELEMNPSFAWGHYVRGSILADAGDRQAAIADLERAVELAPDSLKPFFRSEVERLKAP